VGQVLTAQTPDVFSFLLKSTGGERCFRPLPLIFLMSSRLFADSRGENESCLGRLSALLELLFLSRRRGESSLVMAGISAAPITRVRSSFSNFKASPPPRFFLMAMTTL